MAVAAESSLRQERIACGKGQDKESRSQGRWFPWTILRETRRLKSGLRSA